MNYSTSSCLWKVNSNQVKEKINRFQTISWQKSYKVNIYVTFSDAIFIFGFRLVNAESAWHHIIRYKVWPWELIQTCSCSLTVSAAADVEQTGLSTGAEAFIRLVICPVGEQGLGCNVSIQRDTLHHSITLVNKLHRSEKKQNMWVISMQKELLENKLRKSDKTFTCRRRGCRRVKCSLWSWREATSVQLFHWSCYTEESSSRAAINREDSQVGAKDT